MANATEKLRAITQVLELCEDCQTKVTGQRRQRQEEEVPILDLPIDEEQTCNNNTDCDRGRTSNSRADTHTPQLRDFDSRLPQPTPSLASDQQPANDFFYKRCFVNNVRAVDCDFQAFTIRDCDLDSVTFRNCNFSDVVFEDLKLKNVTFCNVDFRSLWLRDINWICALWDGVGLANAMVTGFNFVRDVKNEKRPRLTLSLKARPTSMFTKTKILYPLRAQKEKAVQDGESKVYCQEKKQELLQLPDKVVDLILTHLFPRSRDRNSHAVMMTDVPVSSLATMTAQSTYTSRSPFGFRSPSFTYHGWPYVAAITPPPISSTDQQPNSFRLKFCSNFLLVSKQCYDLSITHIYDRRFHFGDKPERCLAFLRDHKAPEHKQLAIVLRYSSQTDPTTWRQLFEALLADREATNELTVELSSEFWSSSIWRATCYPETLISWKGWNGVWAQQLIDPQDVEKSPLELVARLPGSRLNVGKVPRKAEDVKFFLQIEGAKGFPSREAFVDEVQMKLRMRMLSVSEV